MVALQSRDMISLHQGIIWRARTWRRQQTASTMAYCLCTQRIKWLAHDCNPWLANSIGLDLGFLYESLHPLLFRSCEFGQISLILTIATKMSTLCSMPLDWWKKKKKNFTGFPSNNMSGHVVTPESSCRTVCLLYSSRSLSKSDPQRAVSSSSSSRVGDQLHRL